jgi:putative DNA primase/helicase
MDVIGNFLKERCVEKVGLHIRVRELYKCYQDWCVENTEHICSERFFSLRLKDMGYTQGRSSEYRFWHNIALLETKQ